MSKGTKAGKVGKILHAFIHSLDKKEKENFTKLDKMTAGKGGSDLLKLFEIYNRMETYEGNWMEKQDLRESFRNNLPKLRTLLFNSLLESLRWKNQRSEKSQITRQQAELDNIRILMGRGFHPSAEKRLPRLEQEISPEEYPINYLQLLDLQRRLELRKPDWNFKQKFARFEAAGKAAITSLSRRYKLALLEGEIRTLGKLTPKIEKGPNSAYQPYLEHPDLQPEAIPQEFLARAYYRNSRGILLLIIGKVDEAFELYSEGMQEWKQHPEKIWDHADLYLSILHHYLHSCIYSTSSLDEFPRIKSEIEEQELDLIPARHRSKKERILNLQTLQFYIYFPDKPQPDLGKIGKWVIQNEEDNYIQISRLIAFYNNLWILNFVQENHSPANFWIQRILNVKEREVQEEVRYFAKLISLICMYELEILEVNQIRSVERVFKKRFKDYAQAENSWKYKFGRILIDFFKRIINVNPGGEDFLSFTQTLIKELNEILSKSPLNGPSNEHLVIWWARGKVEKRSIRECWIEELNK